MNAVSDLEGVAGSREHFRSGDQCAVTGLSGVWPDPSGLQRGIQALEPDAWVRMAPSLRGFVI